MKLEEQFLKLKKEPIGSLINDDSDIQQENLSLSFVQSELK